MHVDRLNRHQRTEPVGILNDDLRDQPRINETVICIHQYALTAILLAPSSHVADFLQVSLSVGFNRLRTGREHFNTLNNLAVLHDGDSYLKNITFDQANSLTEPLGYHNDDVRQD